ncbi:hypothetical protein GN156_17380 [bacterium LRH843]|nr:hypothetical protein [bacterium LRH843]
MKTADNDCRGDMMFKNRIAHLRLEQDCMICRQAKKEGIYVFNIFLCTACEKDIVKLDVEMQNYDYYIEQMRQVAQGY